MAEYVFSHPLKIDFYQQRRWSYIPSCVSAPGFTSCVFPRVFEGFLPQSIKYFPIVPDPEELIGRRYPVRIGILRISKDGVGQPDQTDHVAV